MAMIWRYLTEQCGIPAEEVAVYADLKTHKDFPLPLERGDVDAGGECARVERNGSPPYRCSRRKLDREIERRHQIEDERAAMVDDIRDLHICVARKLSKGKSLLQVAQHCFLTVDQVRRIGDLYGYPDLVKLATAAKSLRAGEVT